MRIKRDKPGRIVTKFLWLPKTIDGEMRWLERATYRRAYLYTHYDWKWFDDEWVD